MISRALLVILFLLSYETPVFSQTIKEEIQNLLNQTEVDSLLLFVRELSGDTSTVINDVVVTIKSRHSEQPGNDKAQEYIEAKLNSYGIDVTIQRFSSSLMSGNTLLIGQVPYSFTIEGDDRSKLTLERYLTRIPDLSINPKLVLPDSYSQETSVGENVLGIQVGSIYPEKKLIVCAHYDCQPNAKTAPGADDNGSGN